MTALRTTDKFCTLTTAFAFALLTAGNALAGPPLATDDAGTVDVGKVEIELNGSYVYDKETAGGISSKRNATDGEVKITTGLYKNLGISLAVPYTFSDRTREDSQLVSDLSGFGDMTVELKYAFAELGGINIAIKPSVILPTGKYSNGLSEGRWQFGGVLIASKEFEEGTYALHANLGLEHHTYRTEGVRTSTESNLWSASIAGEAELLKGLFVVADFGLATNPDKNSSELPVYALTGARYEISDFLDVNAGIKVGLTRPEDDLSLLYGLVLKF